MSEPRECSGLGAGSGAALEAMSVATRSPMGRDDIYCPRHIHGGAGVIFDRPPAIMGALYCAAAAAARCVHLIKQHPAGDRTAPPSRKPVWHFSFQASG